MTNSNVALNKTMPVVILLLLLLLVASFAALVIRNAGEKQPSEQIATSGGEQQVYHWRLVTTWPKNFPGLGTAPARMAEWIEIASQGRLKIDVFGAGEIVPALQVFDAVSQGTVQMGHGAAYYWKGKLNVSPFFTTVPFGLTATEMNGWLHHGGGMELWREAYAPFNLYPLAGGNSGVQMAGWFNKEINSLADLQGLKMRIPGLAGEVFSRAGGEAMTIPGGELFTSLQTGVIDATEWVGPYNDLALGFYEVAEYYYYPGWHEPGPTLELIVNKDAWQQLPPDLQQILTNAARAANQDMLDEYTALNNHALQELQQKHNVKLRRLPDDVLAELHRISDQLLEEQAAQDPQFATVYNAYKRYAESVRSYHHVSEQAYLEARDIAY